MAEERYGICSSEGTKSAPFFCLPGHSFCFSGEGEEWGGGRGQSG